MKSVALSNERQAGANIQVVRGLANLPSALRGASVAMGSFDGLHRGHQAVIALAARAAKRHQAPLAVITFNPLPKVYFRPGQPASRLMRIEQQADVLEAMGVDILYVLPMNELSNLTGEEFARTILHDTLDVRHVAVGFDNAFGRDRTGGPEALRAYGDELGFGVSVAEEISDAGGQKVSSTAVRDALRDGRPDAATSILGRPFAIRGVAQRGRQLPGPLGFPTANVALDDYVTPRLGAYAVTTRLADGRHLPGVAIIGRDDTVGEAVSPLLQVSLFDFDEDICDQVIETDLIAFLRPEEAFESHAAMVAWVNEDADAARRLLEIRPPGARRAVGRFKLVSADSGRE